MSAIWLSTVQQIRATTWGKSFLSDYKPADTETRGKILAIDPSFFDKNDEKSGSPERGRLLPSRARSDKPTKSNQNIVLELSEEEFKNFNSLIESNIYPVCKEKKDASESTTVSEEIKSSVDVGSTAKATVSFKFAADAKAKAPSKSNKPPACGQPLCQFDSNGSNLCNCYLSLSDPPPKNAYQEALSIMKEEFEVTIKSIDLLADTPFRQSRNAYGFSSSLFTSGNVIFSFIHAAFWLSVTVFSLLVLPAVVVGGYVYYRGKKEEEQINLECYADWAEKKFSLLESHSRLIALQRERNLPMNSCELKQKPENFVKPSKEKRGIKGNALSHFIVPFIATTGMSMAVFKFGVLAAVAILAAGGPAAWGIALGIGVAVGLYFAYKRYKHLSRKVKVEDNMALLDARKKDIEDVITRVKEHPVPAPSLTQSSPTTDPATTPTNSLTKSAGASATPAALSASSSLSPLPEEQQTAIAAAVTSLPASSAAAPVAFPPAASAALRQAGVFSADTASALAAPVDAAVASPDSPSRSSSPSPTVGSSELP